MDTETVKETSKQAVKQVEDQVPPQVRMRVREAFSRPWAWLPPTITAGIGVGIGAGATYLYFSRKTKQVVTDADNRIEELKSKQLELDFARAEKDEEFNTAIQQATYVTRELRQQGLAFLESLRVINNQVEAHEIDADRADVEELPQPERTEYENVPRVVAPEERMDQRNTSKLISTGEKIAEQIVNVFDGTDDADWNYEAERSVRTPDEPYIIHVDEFVSDEMGFDSQSTLTWYEGDKILTDSHETPIYNPLSVVGELRFGHGSKDPNVVYVRNEKLKAEYEILRDEGNYEEEVLGGKLEQELQATDLRHANTPRKFLLRGMD